MIDPSRLVTGQSLPVLALTVQAEDIIRYCGAAEDYARPHWDDRFMRDSGFDGIIVHGWMTMAHICRAVEQWFPLDAADVTDYAVRYHKTVYPGPVSYGGTVEQVMADGAVRLSLWARNAAGDLTTSVAMTMRPAA